MISKKLLLFVITCTIIGNPGVIDVYAYGLDLVTLDIFGDVGNFLKKTGQGVTCFTSEIGRHRRSRHQGHDPALP